MAASASSSGPSVSPGAPTESAFSYPPDTAPRGPLLRSTPDSDVFVQLDSGSVVMVPRRLVPLSKLLMDVVVEYDTTKGDPFPCLNDFTDSAFNRALTLLVYVREAWEWVFHVRGAEKMSDLPAWDAAQASWEAYRAEMDEGAREVLSWLLAWPMPDLSTGRTVAGAWYCSHGELDILKAAEKGWLGGVQLLLRCGELPASKVNARHKNEETSLIVAAANGHKEVCEALIGAGADVNLLDKFGRAALQVASERDHTQTCEALLSAGADVNQQENSGMAALHVASEVGNVQVCEALIGAGADVNLLDECKRAALHTASRRGHKEVCEVLFSAGADVNLQDYEGKTALHVACWEGQTEICKALAGAGADVNLQDEEGWTALITASRKGDKEACETLIAAGADMNVRDRGGGTALHHTCGRGNKEACETLIAAGADMNVRDRNGRTALSVATHLGFEPLCEALIGAGADVNLQTFEGWPEF